MIKVRSSEAGVGAANRRKILQAAEKCFAQFGFKGTAAVSYTHLTLPTTPYV